MLVGAGLVVLGTLLHLAMWLSKGPPVDTRRDSIYDRGPTERIDMQSTRAF